MDFSFVYDGKKYTQEANGTMAVSGELTVTVERESYPAFQAQYWVVYFENRSDRKSKIISDIAECDTVFDLVPRPCKRGYEPQENLCVITMKGMVPGEKYEEGNQDAAGEYSFCEESLAKHPVKEFRNVNGRSSDGMMPFFDLNCGEKGYMIAIGWSGTWKARFEAGGNGTRVTTGLQKTAFYLNPGEKVRTASVLVMAYNTVDHRNQFRQLLRTHFSHKASFPEKRDGLFAMEMWGGLESEEIRKRIGELQRHGVSFKDLWIDAGWYGKCLNCDNPFTGDWAQYAGDWTINPRIHPDGLQSVKEELTKENQQIMLWFEPERVTQISYESSDELRKHPEWFLKVKDSPSNLILYYGEKGARDYIFDLFSDFIEKLHLSCYRQDFNITLDGICYEHDKPDRVGMTEILHISGMYELWDRLLAKYPELIIDNCSSGGRRIDIETLKRSIPFFRSDYQCNFNTQPEILQAHNTNSATYFPYIGCTTKTKGDTYAIRSAYASSFGMAFYNAVFHSMSEEDFLWAREISREYDRIKGYLGKDFYNHGSDSADRSSWAIWQYHDEESGKGIVMAFRRPASPFSRAGLILKGLRQGRKYLLTDGEEEKSFLGGEEISLTLPQKRSSLIIEYKKAE